MVLLGVAFTLVYGPLTIIATAGVADAEQGLASGLWHTSFQFGAALGLAVATSLSVAAADGARRASTPRSCCRSPPSVATTRDGWSRCAKGESRVSSAAPPPPTRTELHRHEHQAADQRSRARPRETQRRTHVRLLPRRLAQLRVGPGARRRRSQQVAPWVNHIAGSTGPGCAGWWTFLMAQGIRQFLDLGSGIPTVGNVHELAQRLDPATRVVYVDYEAVAVHHSLRAAEGQRERDVVWADVRNPRSVLDHEETRRLHRLHAAGRAAVRRAAAVHRRRVRPGGARRRLPGRRARPAATSRSRR